MDKVSLVDRLCLSYLIENEKLRTNGDNFTKTN